MVNFRVNIMGFKVLATGVSTIIAIIALLVVVGVVWAMSYWTDSNIEWLILTFADKVVDVPFWLSVILTLILNAVALVFNVIVEILKYVM